VLERLSDLFVRRAVPEHSRSDNGSEFTAKSAREWLGRVGVKTLYIEPVSPWENGYVESFNGKLRDSFGCGRKEQHNEGPGTAVRVLAATARGDGFRCCRRVFRI
jgi:transposase InsO family protein